MYSWRKSHAAHDNIGLPNNFQRLILYLAKCILQRVDQQSYAIGDCLTSVKASVHDRKMDTRKSDPVLSALNIPLLFSHRLLCLWSWFFGFRDCSGPLHTAYIGVR